MEKFIKYCADFGKSYINRDEFAFRLNNWKETEKFIESRSWKGRYHYKVGHNKFSDWTDTEYRALLTYRPKNTYRTQEPTLLDTSDLPASINWVEKGGVNAVQDQGNCGSCWAFSAIASMEGQHFAQTGKLLKLSEQQCVDCDENSHGCEGGWEDDCMWYVSDNGGISLEADYPYVTSD